MCFGDLYQDARDEVPVPVVSVIRISGMLGQHSFEELKPSIDKAFKSRRNLRAVCLAIDANGGSALESKMIFDYIKMKKGVTIVGKGAAQCLVPVYAFIANNAASGGYLVACAADRIFAHEFSIVSVGSIGTNIQLFETLAKGQEEQLYEISDKFNGIFLRKVEESRQIVVDEKIRNGQVFTLDDAIDAGLVDGPYVLMDTKLCELLMVKNFWYLKY